MLFRLEPKKSEDVRNKILRTYIKLINIIILVVKKPCIEGLFNDSRATAYFIQVVEKFRIQFLRLWKCGSILLKKSYICHSSGAPLINHVKTQ